MDGKAVQSFATKPGRAPKSGHRGERDVDWCKKQYTASNLKGEVVAKTKRWFGFCLHLIADATYEIPVSFSVTKASASEKTETQKLLKRMEKVQQDWLESCSYFLGDKGYDSSEIITWLEGKGITPIIDIRNC